MDEIIQIKCPFDGAVLSVKNQPGIETKSVTCPICRHKYPFTQFRRVTQNATYDGDAPTGYPDGGEHTSYAFDKGGSGRGQQNLTAGRLTVVGTGVSYQLKPGRNIVGRKATRSEADFQIDTGENRMMSREHLVIEVKNVPQKGLVYYVSLYKEKVNRTFIGEQPLLYGDCIVLGHGDTIKLPDASLRFEIPDDDATDYSSRP